jgi:hypothetical protein
MWYIVASQTRRTTVVKSLEEYREQIENEVPYVDIRPYSHNIIGLVLGQIAHVYGKAEANKAIEDFDLESLGWRKEDA